MNSTKCENFICNSENDEEVQNMLKIHMSEKTACAEDTLISAVLKGNAKKSQVALTNLLNIYFYGKEYSTEVLKKYAFVINILLKKAAEKGGLQPFYAEKIFVDFNSSIENTELCEELCLLINKMPNKYCVYVRKYSVRYYSPVVCQTIGYIEENISENLTLSRLSGMQNMSGSYLSLLFKKETGITLTSYVNRTRIKKAMELLETTDKKINDISNICGINDVHYFAKLFKKNTGVTPSEYRINMILCD